MPRIETADALIDQLLLAVIDFGFISELQFVEVSFAHENV